jgi:hypothetical protein
MVGSLSRGLTLALLAPLPAYAANRANVISLVLHPFTKNTLYAGTPEGQKEAHPAATEKGDGP